MASLGKGPHEIREALCAEATQLRLGGKCESLGELSLQRAGLGECPCRVRKVLRVKFWEALASGNGQCAKKWRIIVARLGKRPRRVAQSLHAEIGKPRLRCPR